MWSLQPRPYDLHMLSLMFSLYLYLLDYYGVKIVIIVHYCKYFTMFLLVKYNT